MKDWSRIFTLSKTAFCGFKMMLQVNRFLPLETFITIVPGRIKTGSDNFCGIYPCTVPGIGEVIFKLIGRVIIVAC